MDIRYLDTLHCSWSYHDFWAQVGLAAVLQALWLVAGGNLPTAIPPCRGPLVSNG